MSVALFLSGVGLGGSRSLLWERNGDHVHGMYYGFHVAICAVVSSGRGRWCGNVPCAAHCAVPCSRAVRLVRGLPRVRRTEGVVLEAKSRAVVGCRRHGNGRVAVYGERLESLHVMGKAAYS